VAKTNYHQLRRQKETARKARQQEKLARKLARANVTPAEDPAAPPPDSPSPDSPPADPKETL
jgi:hypothetical protein